MVFLDIKWHLENGTGAFSEGASSGECPVGEQRRPGHHPATA